MKNMAKNWKMMLFYVLIPVLLVGVSFLFLNMQNPKELKYSEVVNLFKNQQVSEFTIDLTSGSLSYKTIDNPDETKEYTVPSVTYFLDDIRDSVNEHNDNNPDNQIVYNYTKSTSKSWIISLLPSLLLGILLVFGAVYIIKKMNDTMQGENNRTLGFGKIRARSLEDSNAKGITFKDVAGCDEEKEELQELVEFLKDPKKFTELGARIPKGVLLVGPPGTGKTLLAKAVAGEANAPFFSISGSDFVEMYVGVGASRVRDLFSQAIKKSPSIIFIDEIDAVGRHRGTGNGNSNDEREQTLNQMLVEMDGFGTNSGVIVIAATNRPDVLDPALLRPGRFDRQITVNKPDAQGREDILKVHSRFKPLAPDVDLHSIAMDTIGYTGADLENLLNEAALLAARRHKKAITAIEIQDAASRVEMGTEKKSHKYSEKVKKLTAYHEAGHAVVSYYLDKHDPVKEISIIPRGLGAGGYTWYQQQDEDMNSREQMLELLISLLGGRVAEAISLDDISTGASNDLERASQICRVMVTKYGMSDGIGPVVYKDSNDDYFYEKNYSEATAERIDVEIEKMLRNAYSKTENILKEHNEKLILVAETLIDKEKITGEQFKSLMKTGELPAEEENEISISDTDEVDNTQIIDETEFSEEIKNNPADSVDFPVKSNINSDENDE